MSDGQARVSCGSLPSQHASAQTTVIVTSELAAMATAEGGGGATIMPTTVKARMRRESTESQSFFARDRLVPDTKKQRPATAMKASIASATGMACHSPRPTFVELGPAIGNSGAWTSASRSQCEKTAAATRTAARIFACFRRGYQRKVATPASADQTMLASKPCE